MARTRSSTAGRRPIWHPRWALEALWNFEIPEDLQQGYGYPALTKQAKKKILGENLARSLGIDIEAKKQKLATDQFAKAQKQLVGAPA